MEQFLPFLILIIFGLVSAFSSKSKEKKDMKPVKEIFNMPKKASNSQEKKSENTSVQPTYETDFGDEVEHLTRHGEKERSETQIEMDKRKYESLMSSERSTSEKGLSDEQKQFKKRVRSNLNKKGLVNGIIMSEVLGKPRAMKPYNSVSSKKRN
ncbi:hypothetical protein [Virgibacillus ihumii]|uniref:hypothetical protein n=1 Tax=Virgibacillus ihumii TaxID=2686091 RepID=UPI00157D06BE|nr:hypothetical protein [Virgibacillus ihumii]